MISGRKKSHSFVTLRINAGRHDYLVLKSLISVLHAINELYIARDDGHAI